MAEPAPQPTVRRVRRGRAGVSHYTGRRRGRIRTFFGFLGDHPVGLAAVIIVLLLVAAGVTAKVMADGAADSATEERVSELSEMLDGATIKDFLAFNEGVEEADSIAQNTRDQPDFVNVRATADLSFLRFQPEGWWSGFTERCIVARVTDAGVEFRVPKTACVRVAVPNA